MPETVMIVTGETSGELYGSLLAISLKKKAPDVRITGVGGERMIAAGVEPISGISSAFGIAEALSAVKALRKTYNKAVSALDRDKPAVLVLIDYPDFNMKLAAEAKRKGIKILYYVSPQVWAWRRKRVKKIAALVDRMAVILPFEEALYSEVGLDCAFVGHPVLDEIRSMNGDRALLKKELGLDAERPLLSLLPGSRPHELDRLLPVVYDVVRDFKEEFRDFQFCVPFAPNTDVSKHDRIVEHLKHEGVLISKGDSLRTLAASDYAVVASGTASLQAVFLGVPIVVIYRLFPLTYWLGKMIVKVKYISLVNILAGEMVVRELLQSEAAPKNIISEIRRLIADQGYRGKMGKAYEKVKKMFPAGNTSDRVADMVIRMAGWKI